MDTKAFGIYVGLMNKLTNSNIAVKDALKNPAMVGLFTKLNSISTKFVGNIESTSTRRRSLNKLREDNKLGEYQLLVYKAIRDTKKITRQELAEHLNMPINTVCARVRELIDMNKVYVSGETFNEQTKRYVECLSVTVLRINL